MLATLPPAATDPPLLTALRTQGRVLAPARGREEGNEEAELGRGARVCTKCWHQLA